MFFEIIDHPLSLQKEPGLLGEFYVSELIKVINAKMGLGNSGLKTAMKTGRVGNCVFLDNNTANIEIAKHLLDDKPFFLSRYGATEMSLCMVGELIKLGAVDKYKEIDLVKGKRNSGIFPMDVKVMDTFVKEYESALRMADMNAYWGSLILEEYMCKKLFHESCKQHTMRALEPFQYENPWTSALTDQKVLVVSPFAELIQAQYAKRDQLFSNKGILPEYKLYTVQAIQSSGDIFPEDYDSWSDALDALTDNCLAVNFDIALLSCGSYAVALGARLKAAGKKAIVLGGMLQLVYGIKGARWEQSRPDIVALYNSAWIRAGEKYKIKGTEKMADGAAYW